MWSLVVGAVDQDDAIALGSLERLAKAYWQPLFVFARQHGVGQHEACDAVQGFFQHLLSREVLLGLEQRETRFRSFLLACFSNWLKNLRREASALQRGGDALHLPLEELTALDEARAAAPESSPWQHFDRCWARALFDHALMRLDAEIAERVLRREFFEELRQRLIGPLAAAPAWEQVAQRHSMSVGTVRKAMHDLRQRFATLLRQEVHRVVVDESEVDEELRYLIRLLTSEGHTAENRTQQA
jgi:DNA-directed RNA polymerase specialized sigma24 family protein